MTAVNAGMYVSDDYISAQNFAKKFQVTAEKTATNSTGEVATFYVAPCTFFVLNITGDRTKKAYLVLL